MSVTIQLRRDTAANWTSVNPVLASGEPGLETDTGKVKYGNGSTAWASLGYWNGGGVWNGGTATEWVAPAVATVTDGSTVVVNAALGNVFRITLTTAVGATRTIAAPENPVDGQQITFELIQPSSGGPLGVTWASGTGGFNFGSGAAPTLQTTANASDLVTFRYSGAEQQWLQAGSGAGSSLQKAANLSDVESAAISRSNLGVSYAGSPSVLEPDGVPALGSTGTMPDAGHVHPLQPWQFQPEAYGAKGDGKVILGAMTSGSAVLTAASGPFSASDAGKHIMVHGALGTTSGPLITTIASYQSPSQVTLTAAAAATVANCPAVYGTDDTAAVAAAVSAAGSYAIADNYFAEVLFGAKTYILASGPTQTGNGSTTPTFNSQIPLPYPAADGSSQKLIIALTGAGDNGWLQYWESVIPNVAGTALVSMLTGPVNGDPTFGRQSVVGGPTGSAGFTSTAGTPFANVKPVAKGISIWLPILTNTKAWDFSYCAAARAQQCNAQIFAPTGAQNLGVQPYLKNLPAALNVGNTGSVGFHMSAEQNNTDVTMDDCAAEGYSRGFQVSDWFAASHMSSIYCDTALFINPDGGIGHLIAIEQLDAEAYNYGVRTAGISPQTCSVAINMSTECSGVDADIYDPGNYLRGVIHFQDPADAPRGITVNGAANLKVIWDQLGPGVWSSAPAVPGNNTAQQNTAWRDATVYVSGGTVTGIAVDGTTLTGVTSGPVRVPSGHSITLTYSSAPTWQWVLD